MLIVEKKSNLKQVPLVQPLRPMETRDVRSRQAPGTWIDLNICVPPGRATPRGPYRPTEAAPCCREADQAAVYAA
ncbi:hypothetical protein WJX74_001661 [Apatococcus lobatus]|uniref:Uncharacterized protein n=1 Tax=Apatococcus lobatus TaxID=904363 RepID=A0AAW1R212_9CHLO